MALCTRYRVRAAALVPSRVQRDGIQRRLRRQQNALPHRAHGAPQRNGLRAQIKGRRIDHAGLGLGFIDERRFARDQRRAVGTGHVQQKAVIHAFARHAHIAHDGGRDVLRLRQLARIQTRPLGEPGIIGLRLRAAAHDDDAAVFDPLFKRRLLRVRQRVHVKPVHDDHAEGVHHLRVRREAVRVKRHGFPVFAAQKLIVVLRDGHVIQRFRRVRKHTHHHGVGRNRFRGLRVLRIDDLAVFHKLKREHTLLPL